jgi:hypothetical protein
MTLPAFERIASACKNVWQPSAKPALLSTGEVLVGEFQEIHGDLENLAQNLKTFKQDYPKPEQDNPPDSKEEAAFREWDSKLQDFTSSASIISRRKTKTRAKPPFASPEGGSEARPSRSA